MQTDYAHAKMRDYSIAAFFIVATILGSLAFLRIFIPSLFWLCGNPGPVYD